MFPNWEEGIRQIEKSLDFGSSENRKERSTRAFISLRVKDLKDADAAIAAVLHVPNVTSIDKLYGEDDLMVVIEAPTPEILFKTIEKLRVLANFGRINIQTGILTHSR